MDDGNTPTILSKIHDNAVKILSEKKDIINDLITKIDEI